VFVHFRYILETVAGVKEEDRYFMQHNIPKYNKVIFST